VIMTPPVAPRTSTPLAAAPKAEPPAATRPLKVLVVEDEPAISRIISILVERGGHSATVASRGDDAWEMLSSTPEAFDAVIMDLDLPGLNGVELGKRAKALPFAGPILVISGRVTDADRLTLAKLGITAVFSKPFTAQEFIGAFQAHVAAPVQQAR
jgi:DNA-binding response OmpR family regulator